MKPQAEWAAEKPDKAKLATEATMKSIKTSDVNFPASSVKYAGTNVVEGTVKSTEDVVREMRTWLKTGIAPDGTRMMTDEASQWYQDFYQGTIRGDEENECLPEGSNVDYYYWTTPFLSHIGNIDLVMMHSQVNLRDGTHLPCDRLRETTKASKNLNKLAEKRLYVEERERREFIDKAVEGSNHRGHPLRKDGVYTRYIWRPLHQRTVQEIEAEIAAAANTEANAAAATTAAAAAAAAAATAAGSAPERIPTVIQEAHEQAAAITAEQ